MKSVVVEAYGSVDEFKMTERQVPKVKGNEVLVEVHAVSVNPIDWKIRAGYLKEMMAFSFPIVFGWDVSGVVKEVGEQVNGFQSGDKVFAKADMTKPGGFAECIVVEDNLLVKNPQHVTFEEAAAIPLAGLTAWQMLSDHAKVNEGEKVLIHAGSGGVGSFAIQFAKYIGATVATTTSRKNTDFVKDLGADIVINYEEEDFAEQVAAYDVVLDTLGGDVLEKSYDILKQGGRLITIAGQPNEELAQERNIIATYINSSVNVEQLARVGGLVSEGTIKVAIAQVFPFREEGVREAHQLSETGHARGKIIVKVK